MKASNSCSWLIMCHGMLGKFGTKTEMLQMLHALCLDKHKRWDVVNHKGLG